MLAPPEVVEALDEIRAREESHHCSALQVRHGLGTGVEVLVSSLFDSQRLINEYAEILYANGPFGTGGGAPLSMVEDRVGG